MSALTHHWNAERYKKSGWAKEVERIYASKIINSFGFIEITRVKAKDIRNWHKDLMETPVEANRALNVLSKLFSYAEEQEIIPQNQNPCKLVKPHREKKRKRFATPEELKKILDRLEINKESNPKAVLFIYLLIFSGARPRSIERAKWSQLKTLDHDGEMFGLLTFDGKSTSSTGEDEQVIIPPIAMELLVKTIPTEDALVGIKMPRDFWDKIRKEAGCADLWARDLRRTFATIGLSNGESSGVIGELLNHKSADTTKIYTQLLQTKKIETTKNIAATIHGFLKIGVK